MTAETKRFVNMNTGWDYIIWKVDEIKSPWWLYQLSLMAVSTKANVSSKKKKYDRGNKICENIPQNTFNYENTRANES